MSDKKAGAAKSLYSIGGIVLLLFILISLNVLFARMNLRWDATQDSLYSLSDGTRDILSNLRKDVVIKLFYSQDTANLPLPMKTYAKQVLDFLSEYELAGKGRVTVEFYDPKVDSEEEEWAQKYGIQAMSLPTGETVYLGLVALAADQEETIAYLDPTRGNYLEYDITRIIARLQNAEKPTISVISGLPVFGSAMPMAMPGQPGQEPPWLIIDELKKSYEVKEVRPSANRLDEGTDLVLIIYPKEMSDQLRYAVDQYVLAGGNVIAYVDPLSVLDSTSGQQPGGASLDVLFESWGVSMAMDQILVDMDNPTRLTNRKNQVETDPTWISLGADAFSRDSVITGKLESMLLPLAGAFKKEAKEIAYLPLLQSSANSSMINRMLVQAGPDYLRRDFKPDTDRYDLAVMLRGKFKTAFPEGGPVKDAGSDGDIGETETAHLTGGQKEAAIVLVSDADLLFDQFYVNQQNFLGMNITQIFNDNLNFLLNTAEMLTGSSALIDLRSRGVFERPFSRVEALEKKAQERWLAREQELVKKVEETNRKLRDLEKTKDASQQFILSEEQEREIEKFKDERLRINRELKMVRRSLRAEIESLGARLKFLNIFGVSFLVALGGGFYAYRRRKKRLQHT
jgi:ABC-type uncharacterized transport system involved in gliding motility auxiliary subunit